MTNAPGPQAGHSPDDGTLAPAPTGAAEPSNTETAPHSAPTPPPSDGASQAARQTSPASPASPGSPASPPALHSDAAGDPSAWAGHPGDRASDPTPTDPTPTDPGPGDENAWPVVGDQGWPIAVSSAAAPLTPTPIPAPDWPPSTSAPSGPGAFVTDPDTARPASDATGGGGGGADLASPLSEPTHDLAAPDSSCPHCGAPVSSTETFCENCGADLVPGTLTNLPATAQPATAQPATAQPAPGSAADLPPGPPGAEAAVATRALPRPAAPPDPMSLPASRSCPECGGRVGDDLYCEQCGTKAASRRDHYVEQPEPWLAGVCDRGVRHPRNEDALAVWAEPGTRGDGTGRAALVVCDGVSTSSHSDAASLAAVRAAIGVLSRSQARGLGVESSELAVTRKLLGEAAAAANAAVVATSGDESNPPSCTYAVAVLEGRDVTYGNIGDSRVYWIGDRDTTGGRDVRALTVDDSMAEVRIQMGVSREVAENSPQAHAITRWLGADAPDLEPTTGQLELDHSGWLLVCSDGLWNYASEATRIAELIDEAISNNPDNIAPEILAASLVRWANLQGGKDNISVALARITLAAGAAPASSGAPEPGVGDDEVRLPDSPA